MGHVAPHLLCITVPAPTPTLVALPPPFLNLTGRLRHLTDRVAYIELCSPVPVRCPHSFLSPRAAETLHRMCGLHPAVKPCPCIPLRLPYSSCPLLYLLPGRLRHFTDRVAYILPVSDDGGSTAEIVRVLGGPAVGDIRSRCLRLADDSDTEVGTGGWG